MFCRSWTCAFSLAAALMVATDSVRAADEAKFPNWKGQWLAINPPFGDQIIKFDPTKRSGPWQQAPLTREYQKVHEAYQLHLQVQRRNTTVILKVLARLGPRKERGHLRDDHSSCGAVNMIRIKETLVCLPMDREGYHIGGQSCYRALSSLLRASGSLHPSVKSNDCWNRMASAVEPAAGTVPSI